MFSTITLGVLATCLGTIVHAATPCPNGTSWTPGPLQWGNCTFNLPSLDCANLSVPIDWSNPDGEKLTLGMSRLRAANASSRIGNLFINYGGPGEPSTDILIGYALKLGSEVYISDTLLEHFDIIGVDPRGIGTSTPLQCDTDLFNQRVSYVPETQADFDRMVAHNKAFGESCERLSGSLVRHMDTTSVARDFEAVRIALGGEKMNFLGLSYGTLVAATYANLFPKNVRALVLDSNVEHSQTSINAIVTESQTYENVLDIFAEWCSHDTDCALHGQDVGVVIDEVLAAADKSALVVPNAAQSGLQPNVTGEDLRFNMQGMLLSQNYTWLGLGQALSDAKSGNGTLFSTRLAASNNSNTLTDMWGLTVGCLDWRHPSRSASDIQYIHQATTAFAPRTQGICQSFYYATACIGWPFPIQNPPHWADVHGTPPILMVNALHDPETSYVWAEGLRQQIDNSVLLTRNGSGHISYYLAGEASRRVDAYLVSGTLPAQNTIVNS